MANATDKQKIAFFKLEDWEKEYFLASGLADEAEIIFVDEILDKDHIPQETDFDAVSVFVNSKIDAETLEHFPNLKFIAARSTGYDHIDLEECKRRGVSISTVPSYGENTVAEHAFALLLTLSRKIYESYDRIRETGSFDLTGLRGFDLKGKTLGVIGTGRIGRHIIKMAQGFEMKVIAHDAYSDEKFAREMDFEYNLLEDVLKGSDIITLHVPYLESTHHLINKDNIGLMKKGAILINTARGAVVETDALVRALQSGHLAGAGLDVLEEEGVIQDELKFLAEGHPEEHNLKTVLENHILIDMPNVIITPHNAFNTTEAIKRIFDTTIENIKWFLRGNPINIV